MLGPVVWAVGHGPAAESGSFGGESYTFEAPPLDMLVRADACSSSQYTFESEAEARPELGPDGEVPGIGAGVENNDGLGVVVRWVRPGGPAARLIRLLPSNGVGVIPRTIPLSPGDVLLRVDGQEIWSTDDLVRIVGDRHIRIVDVDMEGPGADGQWRSFRAQLSVEVTYNAPDAFASHIDTNSAATRLP